MALTEADLETRQVQSLTVNYVGNRQIFDIVEGVDTIVETPSRWVINQPPSELTKRQAREEHNVLKEGLQTYTLKTWYHRFVTPQAVPADPNTIPRATVTAPPAPGAPRKSRRRPR